jgi:ferrochelatase
MTRIAVVLCNLGGPDGPEAVRPFLFNLFSDPAILRVPRAVRWLLATAISRRRAPLARGNYALIGGRSPLLEQSQLQATALRQALGDLGEVAVFVAMRYWHPFSDEVARTVRDWRPTEIVLLPLYPQFSTTTSASSLDVWAEAARTERLRARSRAVCCYPTIAGLVEAQAELILPLLAAADGGKRPRLLFSAHGLPQKIVDAGDPYPWQVERTATAVAAALAPDWPELDWRLCYQSRVGPLKWIGPSTEAEIARAGSDGVPLVLAPIAFVSEHVETLVELDIEYRHLAEAAGVPAYHRVSALGTHPKFIAGLAAVVRQALAAPDRSLVSAEGGRVCPLSCGGCRL